MKVYKYLAEYFRCQVMRKAADYDSGIQILEQIYTNKYSRDIGSTESHKHVRPASSQEEESIHI